MKHVKTIPKTFVLELTETELVLVKNTLEELFDTKYSQYSEDHFPITKPFYNEICKLLEE